MLTESREQTAPKQITIREELSSTFQFVLGAASVSCLIYVLLTVSPYLIDSKCTQPGYAPVTLAECLPESEVKSTAWEASIPTPLGDITLIKGKPVAQVLPFLFSLWIFTFLAVVAVSTLGRVVSLGMVAPFAQSGKTPKEK